MAAEVPAGHVPRDRWGSRLGFILAAMGSAIGLGNIWRYPYVVYEHGGGAFLIPYFIALASAAIPVLIMEYALGHRYQGAAPLVFRSLRRRVEWLGWWQVTIAFAIATYYVVIVGWVTSYLWYSVGTRWGRDTESFFLDTHLAASDGFFDVGGIRWKVLLSVALVWAVTYVIMRLGVRRGIEATARVLLPLLIAMVLLITIRGVTLPHAAGGLDVLLTPDFGALTDARVWVAAYGQVFFSLSIGFAIMITYASYLPARSDLANSAVIVGLSNAGFEFLAALGVFSVLGFFAAQQQAPVTEVAGEGGIGLAFIAFPRILTELPALNSLFAVLFFGSLLFAGLTSLVSILECGIGALREKFRLSRVAAVNWFCGLAALVSVGYATRGGLYYLDVVDHFVNSYGIVLAGLAEVVVVAWWARQLGPLSRHVNAYSYLRVGRWWTLALTAVTPVLLGLITVFNLHAELTSRYGDYPAAGLLAVGWGMVAATVVAAVVLQYTGRWAAAASPQEDSP